MAMHLVSFCHQVFWLTFTQETTRPPPGWLLVVQGYKCCPLLPPKMQVTLMALNLVSGAADFPYTCPVMVLFF